MGKNRPQISPLRYAPVEMTKGRAVVVRSCGYLEEQTADLSTPLRSGRDDKGEDGCSPQLRLWVRTDRRSLHSLRSGRDDKGEGGCGPQLRLWGRTDRRSLHSAALRSR